MPKRYATDGELLALAPGYSILAPALRLTYLGLAEEIVGLDFWGSRASYAHALYAAHLLWVSPDGTGESGGGAAAGPLAAEANGPASRSYATTSPGSGTSDDDLALSPYGLMLIRLRKTVKARSSVVSMRRGFKGGIVR